MSLDSADCAKNGLAFGERCPESRFTDYITHARPPLSDSDWAMIAGVQWPDNPLRDATSKSQASFLMQMARGCKNYQHETGGLLCKSHYFDLQFMHAMGSEAGVPARVTQTRLLEWLGFVYSLILDPDRVNLTLGTLMAEHSYNSIQSAVAPPATRDVNMSGMPARQLFSYISAKRFIQNGHPDVNDHLREFLLGVMLHTIQDAYSVSHTQRDDGTTQTPTLICGKISQFYTYHGQGKLHSKADNAPEVDASCSTSSTVDDPITAGARLIGMINSGVSWDEVVRPYLATAVFPLADHTSPSSPGWAKKRGFFGWLSSLFL
jgi:hypothetical protein